MTIDCPQCKYEHEPSGAHEDDSGEWECHDCGFKFKVLIEYDPCYLVSCETHEWSEWKWKHGLAENTEGRWCTICGQGQLR